MPDQQHVAAIEAGLFGSSEAPEWLASSVTDCQARYSGLSLTEEFQSAIKAFDLPTNRNPFELFVVGEGKFGKSTLVNCLLGEELSRVRVLPETRCFLRYVLKEESAAVARFYVRPTKGVHDWLMKRLGPGQMVPSLYRVSEHEVGLAEAKEVLAEEIARLDGDGYDPAILEVERDVRRSGRSAFNSDVRVVDTQGLDQLFPGELKQQAIGLSDSSSQQLFINWMNSTPRGKYLEWQFRRCDSVLWCVSAKRLGSAATAAALRYFSAYSKKIIMALTGIDLVVKKDGDLERLLVRARELYGQHVADICPVNGQLAWKSIAAGDDKSISASGLPDLVERLESICISQGNKVRNLSRYFAVRRTERQYRDSLRELHSTYGKLSERYRLDQHDIELSHGKSRTAIVPKISALFSELSNEVIKRTGQLSLSDDQFDAERKVGFSVAAQSASTKIYSIINDDVIPALAAAGQHIAPYKLPSFDADGKVSGSLVRIDFLSPRIEWEGPSPRFTFSLESLWGTEMWLKFREFFGSKKAREERLELELQRRNQLTYAFHKHWKAHLSETSNAVLTEIDRLYDVLLDELNRVFARIEKEASGSLPVARRKIETALAALSVLPAVSNGMVRAIEQARNRML